MRGSKIAALKWWTDGGSNNPYVQAWLDKGISLSYNLPSSNTISALNTFFDSIDSIMSKAEMIKVYGLNDVNLENISTINFVDPDIYQSTLVNSPIYDAKGFISNGTTSYINENIAINRRLGIKDDFTGLADVISDSTNIINKDVFGSQVTGGAVYYIARPMITGGFMSAWSYSTGMSGVISNPTHNGFYSLKSDTTRYGVNGIYAGSATLVAPTLSNNICTLTWLNSAGSPATVYYDEGYVSLRIESYELSETEINLIESSHETFKTAVGI